MASSSSSRSASGRSSRAGGGTPRGAGQDSSRERSPRRSVPCQAYQLVPGNQMVNSSTDDSGSLSGTMRTPTVFDLEPAASSRLREVATHVLMDANRNGSLAQALGSSDPLALGIPIPAGMGGLGATGTGLGQSQPQPQSGGDGRRPPASGNSSNSGTLDALEGGLLNLPRTIQLTPEARQALRQDGCPVPSSAPPGQLESPHQGNVPVFMGNPFGMAPLGLEPSEQGGSMVPAAFGQPSAPPLGTLPMQPPLPPPNYPPPTTTTNNIIPDNNTMEVDAGTTPVMVQVNQENSVTFQNLTQNLNVAYATHDPQIIAEAWAAIDAARGETASVSAQASHAVGSLQSQLEAAGLENQRIREEAARYAAIAERENLQLKQEAHRALAARRHSGMPMPLGTHTTCVRTKPRRGPNRPQNLALALVLRVRRGRGHTSTGSRN